MSEAQRYNQSLADSDPKLQRHKLTVFLNSRMNDSGYLTW